jgi:hypothetical protein
MLQQLYLGGGLLGVHCLIIQMPSGIGRIPTTQMVARPDS